MLKKLYALLKNNSKPISFLAIGILIGAILVPVGFTVQNRISQKAPAEQPFTPSTYTIDLGPKDSKVSEPSNQSTLSENSSISTPTSNTPKGNIKYNSSTSSSNNTPSTVASPSTVQQPVPTCNETLKASYTNKYNADISYENSVHQNWRFGGPADSSYYYAAKATEDARHNAALNQIKSEYNINLSSINCI